MYGQSKIPSILWIFLCIILVLSFLGSQNFLLSVALFLYIPFLYRLFFISGHPNVIFWSLLYQWLTVSVQLIYCNFLGISLNDFFKNSVFPGELMEYTDWLSIVGIYSYTLGIFMALRRFKIAVDEKVWYQYSPRKLFQVYIGASVIINFLQFVIWGLPNLVQYFFFFFFIKWGFFVVSFILIFKRGPALKLVLLTVIVFEFLLGLSSFFANNFLNILVFSLIAFSSLKRKISYQQGILFFIMGILLLHISVLWTASKKDYRSFLNQGQMTQSVNVSKEAARAKLLELIVKVDAKTYNDAIRDMVNRIGYIQYFAAAVRFVPSHIPYEYGAVYGNAISYYLVPRFINPDKESLDDSKHTNKYTGLGLSGKNRGTSFSLGSFADAYIDFGPVLMFIPIFLFGFLVGLLFKFLYRPDLWGLIFTVPFFLLINIYGLDTTKALGFILIYFLVIVVLKGQLFKYLDPLMRKN